MSAEFTLNQSLNDPLCLGLALHIAEYANRNMQIGLGFPSELMAVRAVRTYNALNVPVDKLPLLRVFRLKDFYRPQSTFYKSVVNVDYWLPIPVVETLPGFIPYMVESTVESILSFHREHRFSFPEDVNSIEVEYKYQENHTDQIVMAFSLTTTLSKVPCGSIKKYAPSP